MFTCTPRGMLLSLGLFRISLSFTSLSFSPFPPHVPPSSRPSTRYTIYITVFLILSFVVVILHALNFLPHDPNVNTPGATPFQMSGTSITTGIQAVVVGSAILLFIYCAMAMNQQTAVAQMAVLASRVRVQQCFNERWNDGEEKTGGSNRSLARRPSSASSSSSSSSSSTTHSSGTSTGELARRHGESSALYLARMKHLDDMHVWADRALVLHADRYPITLFGITAGPQLLRIVSAVAITAASFAAQRVVVLLQTWASGHSSVYK